MGQKQQVGRGMSGGLHLYMFAPPSFSLSHQHRYALRLLEISEAPSVKKLSLQRYLVFPFATPLDKVTRPMGLTPLPLLR